MASLVCPVPLRIDDVDIVYRLSSGDSRRYTA